ncbi:MAG: NnrU family protein [Roseovarius sp.]|nr:NnrU family protein [Roseovarius sp.]
MGWAEYAAALAVFFLSHSLPLRPRVKSALVVRLGRRGFSLGYSALSLGVLYWVLMAAGRAPYVPLWGWAAWQVHVTWLAMLVACLLAALAIARPNPFSFGGRGGNGFDPARPGLIRYTRHPLLVALALWAGGHLVPNGDLAHVALFGLFAGFAILGQRIVDRRRKRLMGAQWARLDAACRAVPPWPPRPASARGCLARLALGLAAFAGIIALHPCLIGVSPLP